MSENVKMQDSGNAGQVGPNTRATILQAIFEHYFKMAMDHHTKAGTTSQVLLVIVGAIISFVTLDSSIGGTVDVVWGVALFGIGLFGALWTWKQHERYYFWQHVAYEYQNELKKIVPELQTGKEYYGGARRAAAKVYTSCFARRIHERYLWVSLHCIVAVIGLGLALMARAT